MELLHNLMLIVVISFFINCELLINCYYHFKFCDFQYFGEGKGHVP